MSVIESDIVLGAHFAGLPAGFLEDLRISLLVSARLTRPLQATSEFHRAANQPRWASLLKSDRPRGVCSLRPHVPGLIPERPSIILKPGVIKLDGQFHPKTSNAVIVPGRAHEHIFEVGDGLISFLGVDFRRVPRQSQGTIEAACAYYALGTLCSKLKDAILVDPLSPYTVTKSKEIKRDTNDFVSNRIGLMSNIDERSC